MAVVLHGIILILGLVATLAIAVIMLIMYSGLNGKTSLPQSSGLPGKKEKGAEIVFAAAPLAPPKEKSQSAGAMGAEKEELSLSQLLHNTGMGPYGFLDVAPDHHSVEKKDRSLR